MQSLKKKVLLNTLAVLVQYTSNNWGFTSKLSIIWTKKRKRTWDTEAICTTIGEGAFINHTDVSGHTIFYVVFFFSKFMWQQAGALHAQQKMSHFPYYYGTEP